LAALSSCYPGASQRFGCGLAQGKVLSRIPELRSESAITVRLRPVETVEFLERMVEQGR